MRKKFKLGKLAILVKTKPPSTSLQEYVTYSVYTSGCSEHCLLDDDYEKLGYIEQSGLVDYKPRTISGYEAALPILIQVIKHIKFAIAAGTWDEQSRKAVKCREWVKLMEDK